MAREVRGVGLLLLFSTAVLLGAYQAPTPVFFDFGPNDGRYVEGFRDEFEIDEPTLFHWSLARGRLTLPVLAPVGPVRIAFRYKRHAATPAEIHLFVGGELVDRFVAERTDWTVKTIALPESPRPWRPVEIVWLARSADPRGLGLALDWLELRAARPLLPAPDALAALLVLVAALHLLARLAGLGPRAAFATAGAAAAALAGLAIVHKLFPIHAAATLGVRFFVLLALVVAALRLRGRRPGSAFGGREARWALFAFVLATTIRAVALFHPDYYYPDVRTHSKFVSLIWTEGLGGFFSDHIAHQHRHLLGLQLVGDRWLAFPYPPLLYLLVYPLSLLRLPVDDWMKIVPTVLVGVEALLVFALAVRVGLSGRAAAFASAFHLGAPLVGFRLAVASFAALFGHFWDVLVALYLLARSDRIATPGGAAGLAGLVAVSLLSYAGGGLVLGLFLPTVAVLLFLRPPRPEDRRRALALLAAAALGAGVAIGAFYLQYVPELVGSRGGAAAGTLVDLRPTPLAALGMAWHRLLLFYGPAYGALVFFGLVWMRGRTRHPWAGPLAVATLVTFLGLNVLRAGLGATTIFQFSKDDLVLLPLAALVLGALADGASRKGQAGRLAAAALLAGWCLWGLVELGTNVRGRFVRPDYPPVSAAAASARAPRARTTRTGTRVTKTIPATAAVPGRPRSSPPSPNKVA